MSNNDVAVFAEVWSLADLEMGAPLGQMFFIFMQFLRKIGQITGWRPSLGVGAAWEILDPPLMIEENPQKPNMLETEVKRNILKHEYVTGLDCTN